MQIYKSNKIIFAMAALFLLLACGPNENELKLLVQEESQKLIDAKFSSRATPTPFFFPTPFPTPTPGITEDEVTRIAEKVALDTVTKLDQMSPTPTAILFPTPFPTPTPGVTEDQVTEIAEKTAFDTVTKLEQLKPTPTAMIFPTPFPPPTPGVNFNEIWLRTYPAVFWIEAGSSRGSGWLLEPGYIVTNQHVVGSMSQVVIRQTKLPPFSGVVIATDQIRDIALIQYTVREGVVDSRAEPFVLGSINNNNSASPLMAMGYSGDLGIKSDGAVGSAPANIGAMAVLIDVGGAVEIVMDAPVDPGDSGGPVLNGSGELVGMVRAGFGTDRGRHIGTNYSVHVDTIRGVIDNLKAGISR